MGNCLVTKLKVNVNNDSLPRLGCIKVELSAHSSVTKYFRFSCAAKLVIVGDGYFTDSAGTDNYGQTLLNPENSNCYIKNVSDGDVMYVYDKYNVTMVISGEANDGNLLIKTNSELNLDYCSSITQIILSKWDVPVVFDFNSFSLYNSILTKFKWHYNTSLKGNIETVVENMVREGRISGSLVISANSSSLKLNGSTFMTGANEHIYIAFNSATDVVVKQGEQGTGDTLATWNGTTWTYPNS